MRYIPILLIVTAVAVTTVTGYAGILSDAGVLNASDDAIYFAFARDGFSACELVIGHLDAIVPIIRLGYHAMYAAFGTWWTPYGISLILSYIIAVSMIGILICRMSGRVTLAMMCVIPLSVSHAFMTGIIQNWWYVFLFYQISALCAVIILLHRYINKDRQGDKGAARFSVLVATVLSFISMFVMFTGAIIFPAVACFSIAFGASWRQLRLIVVLFGSVLLFWLISTLAGWWFLGNMLPGGLRYAAEGAGQPFVVKFYSVILWGLGGLYPLVRIPNVVETSTPYIAPLIIILAALFLVRVRSDKRSRIAVAALICLVFYAAAAARGRDVLAIYHIRYNAFALVFGLVFITSTLSILLDSISYRGPIRHLVPIFFLILSSMSLYAVVINISTVNQSDIFTQRSSLWWKDAAERAHIFAAIRDRPCTFRPSP